MEIKGSVALAEIPLRKRGPHCEVKELLEALQAVPVGHALVAIFPDKRTAARRAASLRQNKVAAVIRGTNVYVSRNGTSG